MFLFLYFVLSSCEQLNLVVGIYKPKAGHVLACLLLGWVGLDIRAWQLDRRMMKGFIFVFASLCSSAVLGSDPFRSFGYLAVYLFNFTVYFFLPLQIILRMELPLFFRIYWSSFVVVGCYALYQVLMSVFGIYDPFALQRIGMIARGQAWTYEPSYYALFMIPYVMYHNAYALFREKVKSTFKRRFKLAFQNLLMGISTSTGLIVSYPIFFLVALLKPLNPLHQVAKQKFKRAFLSFVGAVLICTIVFYEIALHSLFKFFYFGFDKHISFSARWEGIVVSVQTFLKHPFFGVGLGGVSAYHFQEISVYDLKQESLDDFVGFDPTNCFTEVLASLGIVGLLAFIYLGWVFYRSFQDVMKDGAIDLESKKMATALFISLVVMIVALQMNQGLFRPYVWIHAAVVYGYFQRIKTSSSFSSEPSQLS